MKAHSDRGFARELGRELTAQEEAMGEVLPDVDWSALPLFARIGSLAALYRLFYERTLSEVGLTYVELQVLGLLRSGRFRTPGEMARFTHQTAAGMTRTVDRLEDRGWVERRSHPTDRRKVQVVLTRGGRALADRVLREEATLQHEMLAGLGEREREALSRTLDDLISRLAPVLGTEADSAA